MALRLCYILSTYFYNNNLVQRARRYGCVISCQHTFINYNNDLVPWARRYSCVISCQHTFINYNNDLVPLARCYGCIISCQHTFIIIIWFRGHVLR
jgi:hypothetical protein